MYTTATTIWKTFSELRISPHNDCNLVRLKELKESIWMSFDFPENSLKHTLSLYVYVKHNRITTFLLWTLRENTNSKNILLVRSPSSSRTNDTKWSWKAALTNVTVKLWGWNYPLVPRSNRSVWGVELQHEPSSPEVACIMLTCGLRQMS